MSNDAAQQELVGLLREMAALGERAGRLIPAPPPPEGVTVRAGGNLQGALDTGGIITLEAGATFEAIAFTVRSGTVLRGAGATIRGSRGPALRLPPGTADVVLEGVTALSGHDQAVVQIGESVAATQGTLDAVPRRITVSGVNVPTHRGKRAFEVNGAEVSLLNCEVADLWDPAGRDSQAIWIGNTPGPVAVQGGSFCAGSEVILAGGDTMKIPNVVPSDLTIADCRLWRPMTWRTDGVRRVVKNIFELKTGERVTVRNVEMDGCWRDGQDGWAVIITPARGGQVRSVTMTGLRMRNCSGGLNINGTDSAGISTVRTDGIALRDSLLVTNRAALGGRGALALLGGGPRTVEFERVRAIIDGDSLIYHSGERMGRLVLRESFAVAGRYSLFLGGNANAANWQTAVEALEVRGNTFADANAVLRRTLPENRFLTRAEFDALFNPDGTLR